MQNADRSSSGHTRLLKGTVAVQRNSQDILAPPTPYSYKGAGSRVLVAIGGSTECCAVPPIPPIPAAPMITSVTPGDGFVDIGFDSERAMGYPFWTVLTTPLVGQPAVLPVSGQASPIRVTGLTNGLAYTFQLTKTTAGGTSAPSTASAPAIPVGLPGAPTLSVTPGIQQLTITVTGGTTGGSAIIRYERSSDGSTGWTTTTSPFNVTGLANGETARVWVRAVNEVGPGATASVTGTTEDVPDAPTNLRATITSTTATISFTQASDGGSPITNYKYSIDGVDFTAFTSVVTSSPITFTGLITGQTYYVRLIAVNAIGDSPASIPHVVTPASTGPVIAALRTIGAATWNPPTGVTSVNYLVVGGGGGGGGSYNTGGGGGGGGGQLFYASGYGVSPATVYTVTVGDGGARGIGISITDGDTDGGAGSESKFGDILALGGGGGGRSLNDGRDGIGGAQGTASVAPTGGKGGRSPQNMHGGGGGGGMGSAGTTANASSSANGTGVSYNISGNDVAYSAGGVGGRRNVNNDGVAGLANSGNGGGGAGSNSSDISDGGAGGSGIVILAYNVPIPISIPDSLLYFDPANPSSFPVSGTTVTSIGTSTISGTKTVGVTRATDTTAGTVFSFSGVSSYINFDNFNFGTVFTAVGWVKPTTKANINAILSNETSGNNAGLNGFKLGWNRYQTSDGFMIFEGKGSGANTGAAVITIGEWQQIAYSLDTVANTITFYKNGVQLAVGTLPASLNTNTIKGFKVGTFTDGSYGMSGLLGELSVYPAALNPTQVTSVFDSQKARYGL